MDLDLLEVPEGRVVSGLIGGIRPRRVEVTLAPSEVKSVVDALTSVVDGQDGPNEIARTLGAVRDRIVKEVQK